jgi:radical SAM protein with 4Fe4S-binding SPASM domain
MCMTDVENFHLASGKAGWAVKLVGRRDTRTEVIPFAEHHVFPCRSILGSDHAEHCAGSIQEKTSRIHSNIYSKARTEEKLLATCAKCSPVVACFGLVTLRRFGDRLTKRCPSEFLSSEQSSPIPFSFCCFTRGLAITQHALPYDLDFSG